MARQASVSSTSSGSNSPGPSSPKSQKLKRKFNLQDSADSSPASDSKPDESDDESALKISEEPVLSHKERRKQKKRAAKESEDGPPMKKRKMADGAAAVSDDLVTKRQNSVWVGNLAFKTQQENLREFFKSAGEITRINMPTKPATIKGMKPENRGFAYVDFGTREAKTAAIALSEQPLLGRKLLIKDGDSFEGRPSAIVGEDVIKDPDVAQKTHSRTAQKILRSQKQPPGPTLFLGNLPFETTEDAIQQLLGAHRPSNKKKGKAVAECSEDEEKTQEDWIRKIRMGTFEDTGLCKGFAFIDFTSIDNATTALINPRNHHLNGRDLVVEYAGPDAVRRGASKALVPAPKYKPKPLSAGYKKTRGRKPPGAVSESSPAKQAGTADTTADAAPNPNKRREKKDRPLTTSGRIESSARHKGPKSRPKPGAALALAKRETAAIVPSQGKKITF